MHKLPAYAGIAFSVPILDTVKDVKACIMEIINNHTQGIPTSIFLPTLQVQSRFARKER